MGERLRAPCNLIHRRNLAEWFGRYQDRRMLGMAFHASNTEQVEVKAKIEERFTVAQP